MHVDFVSNVSLSIHNVILEKLLAFPGVGVGLFKLAYITLYIIRKET